MLNFNFKKISKYSSIVATLILYVIVATISCICSISFFQMAHAGLMAIILGVSFEIGSMACLFMGLTTSKNSSIVWTIFIILTLFQIQSNVYFSFINLHNFNGWTELFGLVDWEVLEQKRLLAGISGAILPIIALGFIKCLVDLLSSKSDSDNTNQPLNEIVEDDTVSEGEQNADNSGEQTTADTTPANPNIATEDQKEENNKTENNHNHIIKSNNVTPKEGLVSFTAPKA